jgi:hypothetical protein
MVSSRMPRDEPHVIAKVVTGVRLWTIDETMIEIVVAIGCVAVLRPASFVAIIQMAALSIFAAGLLVLSRMYLDRDRVHMLSLMRDGELRWRSLLRSGSVSSTEIKRVVRSTTRLSLHGAKPELWMNNVTIEATGKDIRMDRLTFDQFKAFSLLLARMREFNPNIELSRQKSSYWSDP